MVTLPSLGPAPLRLVRCQPQPNRGEDRRHFLLHALCLWTRTVHHDHEIVSTRPRRAHGGWRQEGSTSSSCPARHRPCHRVKTAHLKDRCRVRFPPSSRRAASGLLRAFVAVRQPPTLRPRWREKHGLGQEGWPGFVSTCSDHPYATNPNRISWGCSGLGLDRDTITAYSSS